MTIPNTDEAKGVVERATGSVKEAVGKAIGNTRLTREGRQEQTRGNVRQKMGKARRKVGEAISDIGDSIKR
jgi:uncharacterized protein YjbJ (UPF0337 family)